MTLARNSSQIMSRALLWGSPINTWTGDMQPIETFHNVPPHVPRWGQKFKDWIQANYRRLFRMVLATFVASIAFRIL